MKKELFLCGALFALMAFVGCSSDDDPKTEAPTLKLSTNSAAIPADGTASTIEVTTNQASWTASRPDNAQWCILKQENNKLIISATVNAGLTPNTTEVTVVAGTGADAKTEKVTVTQSAANAYLTIEGLEANTPVKLDAAGTLAELTINTNAANWNATRPDADAWCTLTKDGNKLKITATAYEEDAERKTTVTLSGGATPVSFEVVQKGEAPAALVYKITIPTDFSKSYVQKVIVDGVKVAEICKEYLRSTVEGALVDAQMVVIYPVIDGKTDLTKGLVIDNGGTVAWDVTNNTCAYKGEAATEALSTVYLSEGEVSAKTESENLVVATVEPELLIDTRSGDTKWSYKITKIGTQYWMAENLKARSYWDGTTIPKITNATEWKNSTTGAYREPDGQTENFVKYGASYNGYVIFGEKEIAPEGWKVPEKVAFKKLVDYVGSSAGMKLKSSSDEWISKPGSDITGFNALPGGQFNPQGEIDGIGVSAWFWCKTLEVHWTGKTYIGVVSLSKDNNSLTITGDPHQYSYGHTVRCVRND